MNRVRIERKRCRTSAESFRQFDGAKLFPALKSASEVW